MRFSSTIASCLLLAGLSSAHPGHDLNQEIAERRSFLATSSKRSLSHCADKIKARGLEAKNIARRSAAVEQARAKRGLRRRDTDSVLAASHNSTGLGYSPATPHSELFGGNNSCLLTPTVTQGPYYVGGEYVRYDITEDQEGVDLIADFQVIDVNTCEPVPQAYLEIWHCNATGVYSGVAASGNGNSDDTSNLDKTFLRGIQTTDEDGVAQFHSIFPGYYTSRSVHIHTMVHTNISGVYRNHTLGNNVYASHVGQTFFDQDLITEVNTVEPYLSTTQELTTNADDGILSEEADEGVDPLMEYTYLGDSIEDGIFAWISYGINATLSDSVTPAAFYYESGGEENDDSPSLGGGGDAPGGNSTSS